jgi:MFS transporter, SHS family, lactate transporter
MAWWQEPTKAQLGAFSASWLAWVLDAFDFTVFLLVMPLIGKEFGVSIAATAASITLTLLLRLVGGIAAGAVADRIGRKAPLVFAIAWFALCDAAVYFAPSFTWVMVFRTLFGFGMGAQWTSGATLAMENWPVRSRALASGVLQGSWAVGYFLAATVQSWVVPHYGWRALFLVAAAPALLSLPLVLMVKEQRPARPPGGPAQKVEAVPFRVLFQRPHFERVVWAATVEALGFGVYYAMSALWPTFLKVEQGLSPQQIGHLVQIFNVAMLAGSVLCGMLAARKGVAIGIWLPALLMLPLIPLYVGWRPELLWVGAIASGGIGVAYVGITPLLLTGLFDESVRARAVGLVYHVGAAAAALVPPAVALLHDKYGVSFAAAVGTSIAACELLLALTLWLRPAGVLPSPRRSTAPAAAGTSGGQS